MSKDKKKEARKHPKPRRGTFAGFNLPGFAMDRHRFYGIRMQSGVLNDTDSFL
jgi:hypothetical protein